MNYSAAHKTSEFATWPQHSTQTQLEKLLTVSDAIFALHKEENNFMTGALSEIIFTFCKRHVKMAASSKSLTAARPQEVEGCTDREDGKNRCHAAGEKIGGRSSCLGSLGRRELLARAKVEAAINADDVFR